MISEKALEKHTIRESINEQLEIYYREYENPLSEIKTSIDSAIEKGMTMAMCHRNYDKDGFTLYFVKYREETDSELKVRQEKRDADEYDSLKRRINGSMSEFTKLKTMFSSENKYHLIAQKVFYQAPENVTDEMIEMVKKEISENDLKDLLK